MAKAKTVETEEKKEVVNSSGILEKLLEKNKEKHLNFLHQVDYEISSGSLLLDSVVKLGPGSHRIIAHGANLGKTSLSLSYMKSFLDEGNRKGLYFNSEGRLTEELKQRSGIKFVEEPSEWVNGTCLVIHSNRFEFIFSIIRELVMSDDKTQIMYILDSTDAMIRESDMDKEFSDASLVAGGALITSTFFKRVALALARKGHIAIFIGQYRSTIKINQYEKDGPKQGSSSGGAALQHYVNVCLNIEPRFGGDLILEKPNDKKSKILGHYCTICIEKSNNEKNKVVTKIPIRYGQRDGNSIWKALEVRDMLLSWGLVISKGAWTSFEESAYEELLKKFEGSDIEIPDKFNGITKLDEFLDQNPEIIDFYHDKFLQMLSE